MPSGGLKLVSLCAYLTDMSMQWRTADYAAMNMVKGLKKEPLKGWFEYEVAGKTRRYDQSNIQQFVDRIPPALARLIALHVSDPATLVPIPNAHVTSPSSEDFRTLELARAVADQSRGALKVSAALVFEKPQVRSRDGGPRSPSHFETAYQIASDVKGPIVLLDDVCTSGGHMIGAHWKLHHPPRRQIVLACAFGRTTKEQLTHPVGIRVEELDTTPPFD
jgi:hypothetical protein